jgi:hypothetical protein
MERHNVIEEGLCDGCRCIGMPERNEVGILRKPVDHRKDDHLVVDAGKSLHEIHGDVIPHHERYVQRLQKTCRLQLFSIVPLACLIGAHRLRHQSAHTWNVEVCTQAMQCLGDSLMACTMGGRQC